MPPWALEATFRCRIFERITDLKRADNLTEQTESETRAEKTTMLIRQWDILLSNPGISGEKTVSAVRPHLNQWINRKHGDLNYQVTQILTGHGSFGHFLYRIGKRESPSCFHCTHQDDTVEHTVAECPAWEDLRAKLLSDIDLSRIARINLETIVDKILQRKEYWSAFSSFATVVITRKEEERSRARVSSPS